ncbi:uncharacterized protein N7482_007987 [Penicillium canariense]|uniref:Uncharacterized protein n=1 Tax=Penicillium canariense TaxID=189055 RepID=A0A9W9LKU3_9EURO|nr:uncharacterized protein N7482_007987 [Penicillium canariense]KAJ5160983.1 hypothetical protein N7482_007987 [Penicillium canariense]
MPHGGLRAFFQLPIFYVAICDWEDKYPKKIIRMLARPRAGLTAELYLLGPYSRPSRLNQYGTVLFVVEDIRLFRVLSLIEMLVNASIRREAMVRKLYVLWEHESAFEYPEWWKSWRQRLLDKDAPRFGGYDILSFRIFRGQAEAGKVRTRVHYYQGSLNVKDEIP